LPPVLIFHETLLVSSLDEISTAYGLLAEAVSFPPDFSSATYRLREQAKWHDGTPVAPDDVVFSFEAFKKYSPQLSANYRHVTKAEKTGDHEVTFTVDAPGNRELPRIVGELTAVGSEQPLAALRAIVLAGCGQARPCRRLGMQSHDSFSL
jgi:microcin C transport system substrate-binding protein